MSVAKDELYRLIEALPDKETPVVKRFLEFVLIRSKTEDQAWLEAELSELPPYEWGPEGPPKGKPVRYEAGP
ncbi:hypothetical protein MTAT_26910 [Moorella thermoacetica]|uniref:DUF2281 domain-containing protein n=1 Tax=Neomoorella thermoacetica TaxID=1525 RepID=A0AAC9HFM2_NEOTH|nr:hypothetical protein Maut_00204 [Moorella thermoacetica]TYL08633.1 hypothetical protein MTAT_26910 [Moorella thermoacetica]